MTAVAGKDRVGDPRTDIPGVRRQRRPVQGATTGRLPSPSAKTTPGASTSPTLLVSGADSPAPLTAVTDKLEEVLPDVSRLNIAGAGHNMFNTHPTDFNAGVIEFIHRH